MNGKDERCIQNYFSLKYEKQLRDLGVDGRIILKWMLKL
jgi:hypothetical protein